MKNTKYIFLLLVLISCKNNQQHNNEGQSHSIQRMEELKDNLFKLELDIIISEDDRLQLFYVDDMPNGTFSAEKRLAYNVKGSNTAQKINFTLPKKSFPFKLRIDLGENKVQSIVKINSIELKFNSDSIFIENSVLKQFFQPNIYLEKSDNGFLRKTLNGRYDPFLVSTPLLEKKIELDL